MREWFGSRQAAAVVDLPTRLRSIVDQLSPGTLHTAMTLINSHTMFPLYRPFLPISRIERILRLMTGESHTGNVHMTIGQTASGVLPLKYLRFCPLCINDDEHDYGESYWHRSHQLPGVRVCNRHQSWLVDSDIPVGGFGSRQSLVPLGPEVAVHQESLSEERYFSHHSWLAKAAHRLLNESTYERPIGLLELRRRYLHYLHRRGLASAAGRLEVHEFAETFLEYYGEAFLVDLHCGVAAHHRDNWLLALVRKYRKTSHPLHHLLLVRFLGLEIEDLLLGELERLRPFGAGPWPCLNPAASHYRRAVVGTCIIGSNPKTGAPVGRFACKCGFTYSRSGPDRCQSDRSKLSRIIATGPAWKERLLQLILLEKRSLRETARQLRVDAKTVQRYLNQLSRSTSGDVTHLVKNAKELNRRRANWQKVSETHPNMGTKALRRLRSADYAWLYRNDRAWLKEHSPKGSPPAPKSRIDWLERDVSLSSLVEQVAKAIKLLPGRPNRVTVARIRKGLGRMASHCRRLDHLPKVRAVLAAVVETKKEFAIRRMRWAVEQLRQQGESVTAYKVVRTAGLRAAKE